MIVAHGDRLCGARDGTPLGAHPQLHRVLARKARLLDREVDRDLLLIRREGHLRGELGKQLGRRTVFERLEIELEILPLLNGILVRSVETDRCRQRLTPAERGRIERHFKRRPLAGKKIFGLVVATCDHPEKSQKYKEFFHVPSILIINSRSCCPHW